MKPFQVQVIVAAGLVVVSCTSAHAGEDVLSDTSNEWCTYNGKKLDHAAPKDSERTVREISPKFSGLVICTDRESKRITERFVLLNGLRHGEAQKFDTNTGRIEEVSFFVKGTLQGWRKKYDSDGKLVSEEQYVDGEVDGVMKEYFPETRRLKKIRHYNRKTHQDGTWIRFTRNGKVESLSCGAQTLVGVDDRWCGRGGKPGTVELWDDDGVKRAVRSYRNNQLHGRQVTFGDNGAITGEAMYENGVEKSSKSYDESAGKRFTQSLPEGDLEQVYFPSSKQLRLEIKRVHRTAVSLRIFFQNGKLSTERTLANHLVTAREFDDHGRPLSEGTYKVDDSDVENEWLFVPHGVIKSWFWSGDEFQEITYKDGDRDGEARYFEIVDGKNVLVEKRLYKAGQLKWLEERLSSGSVLHRDFRPDGSVQKETVVLHPIKI